MGHILVDLDGTLAEYEGFKGADVIGKPIQSMVDRVKIWLSAGQDVRIFTARVWYDRDRSNIERVRESVIARQAIDHWCIQVFGTVLPVTCEKTYETEMILDDRAFHVVKNSGIILPDFTHTVPTGSAVQATMVVE